MSYQRAANLDKNLLAGFYMNSEQEVRRQQGTPSGTVTFVQGNAVFTTDGKITFSNPVYNVRSIRLIVDLDSITEDILQLSSTHSIEVAAGTITATGVSSPTIYVGGVATSTVVAGKAEITITTATSFVADDIIAGYVSAYLEGKIELIELWNVELSSVAISNLYTNSRYPVPHLNRSGLTKILHVTAQKGVVQEISGQNTITDTDVSVFKDGSIRVINFNGGSSLIESTLADNVNTIMFWAKPKTASESIIDLGGGNTITIASGVLTAVWADDLYVDGVSGTAIKHNKWSLIVCRVNTALALTDIDIGKISTAFYDGMLDNIIFIDGIVTDAEVSQAYTSTKNKYNK